MRRIVLPALVAGVVLAPVAAYGFWTLESTAVAGAARAGSLGAPTITSAMSNGDVRISVTAPPASGPRPTTYGVNRTAPTAASDVCTITAAADGTGSCVDPSAVAGQTNTYQVVGRFQDWQALGPAVGSTSLQVAAATTNITAVAATTNVTAGNALTVTVTARTAQNVADVTFTGTRTILVTGAATSPNGTAATVPVAAVFNAGVATIQVTPVRSGSTTLTVSAAGYSASTAAIAVAPAAAASYALAGPATGQAGVAYALTTVSAFDRFGNAATGYTGAQTLTWSGAGTAPNGATPTASTSATFSAGVASNVALTFVKAETAQLKATTGSITTPTALPVTVSGGLPASAAWAGVSSTVPSTGVVNCSGTTCNATALGNDGGIAGTISLTDVYGNPAANAGSGWAMTFLATKTKGQGTGNFTVNGQVGNPVTYTLPLNGSSSVNFQYVHPGTADWRDTLTITLTRDNQTVLTLQALLDKT